MIIRGTTPTLRFDLPFDADMIANGFVVIQQGEVTVVEKEISDCECGGKTVSAKFTQEDTLKLASGMNAEISIVVKTTGGERLETETPFIERVVDTVKDGVI